MNKIDFAKAKAEISEIVGIVKTVPEALQQRCFEMLFELAFHGAPEKLSKPPKGDDKPETKEKPDDKEPAGEKKLPGNILGFMRRNSVEPAAIHKLFMMEHEPMLQVYKLPQGNTAKAQLTKVLMLLLENGLLNNSLSAPYAELRSTVKDEGLFDGNFNKVLKKNHSLFKGAITQSGIDEEGVVELTAQGMEKLAEVIKELGQ